MRVVLQRDGQFGCANSRLAFIVSGVGHRCPTWTLMAAEPAGGWHFVTPPLQIHSRWLVFPPATAATQCVQRLAAFPGTTRGISFVVG